MQFTFHYPVASIEVVKNQKEFWENWFKNQDFFNPMLDKILYIPVVSDIWEFEPKLTVVNYFYPTIFPTLSSQQANLTPYSTMYNQG